MFDLESIDYNYSNCETPKECLACRCTYPENFKLSNKAGFIDDICRHYKVKDVLTCYCIERLIRKYDIFNAWDPVIENGYYGTELRGYKILHDMFLVKIRDLLSLSKDKDKLEFVLQVEYGQCLHDIQKIKIKTVDKTQLLQHRNNKNLLSVYDYANKHIPIGIYEKDGNKFRVIDGRNRLYNYTEKHAKIIVIEYKTTGAVTTVEKLKYFKGMSIVLIDELLKADLVYGFKFSCLTVKQLKMMCALREIDIDDIKKKKEFINLLEE